jgi:hypothetical protein
MTNFACFRHEFDINRIIVNSDQYVNGNVFEQPITLIPHFSNDYYLIQVYQYSLTEEAFNFLGKINEQGTHVGSIFDRIPSRIKGNCYYPDGRDNTVYGYFGASAVTQNNHMMKFETGKTPIYRREYPFKPCPAFPHTVDFNPSDPSTWPEGWTFF